MAFLFPKAKDNVHDNKALKDCTFAFIGLSVKNAMGETTGISFETKRRMGSGFVKAQVSGFVNSSFTNTLDSADVIVCGSYCAQDDWDAASKTAAVIISIDTLTKCKASTRISTLKRMEERPTAQQPSKTEIDKQWKKSCGSWDDDKNKDILSIQKRNFSQLQCKSDVCMSWLRYTLSKQSPPPCQNLLLQHAANTTAVAVEALPNEGPAKQSLQQRIVKTR